MRTNKRKDAAKYVIERLAEIEKKYKTTSAKTSQWRKVANKVKKDLSSRASYHNDLTYIRGEVRDAGYTHPSLSTGRKLLQQQADIDTGSKRIVGVSLTRAIADYPMFEADLRALSVMPIAEANGGKSELKKKMKRELSALKKTDKKITKDYIDNTTVYINQLLLDHPIIRLLEKTDAEKEERNEQMEKSLELKNRNENLKRYNMPVLKKLAEQALTKSRSYTELAWAIALLTGRRSVEVLYHGQFEKIDSHNVMFSGQSKKRQGVVAAPYRIPVLADADAIIKGLKRLRKMPSVAVFRGDKYQGMKKRKLNYAINQRTNKVLNDRAKKITGDSAEVFKNTRGIYARYCTETIMKKDTSYPINDDEFLKAILGHEKTNEVKHYRQVELEYEANEKWVKVKEPKKEPEKEPEKKVKAKRNYRTGHEIKAIGEALENYKGLQDDKGNSYIEIPVGKNVRKIKLDTIKAWHFGFTPKPRKNASGLGFTSLKTWAYENSKSAITQTVVLKNRGNTLESGTGTANIHTNRYTFQAWAKIAGELLTQYNARKTG